MLLIVELNSFDSVDGKTEEQIEYLSLMTAEQRTSQLEDQMTFTSQTVEKIVTDLLATKIVVIAAQMAVKLHYSVFSMVEVNFCREVDSVIAVIFEKILIDVVVENRLIVSTIKK